MVLIFFAKFRFRLPSQCNEIGSENALKVKKQKVFLTHMCVI